MLTDRLAEPCRAGLVARSVAAGPPVSVSCSLTDAGRALLPALERIADWAQEHLPEE